MILKAKIFPKYMNDIINGKKSIEYREIEGIELNDGRRKLLFEVDYIDQLNRKERERIYNRFRKVKWSKKSLMVEIGLGCLVSFYKKKRK